ncbi:MAG: hypothetical protein AAF224_08640 [Pseudomonadota bacterium]
MAAKVSILIFITFVAVGCGGAKRFLPPGFVKYEDLAKDQPVHPDIEKAIEENRRQAAKRFPKVSDQPSDVPKADDDAVRTRRSQSLTEKRDALNAAIDADRRAAKAERSQMDNADRQ